VAAIVLRLRDDAQAPPQTIRANGFSACPINESNARLNANAMKIQINNPIRLSILLASLGLMLVDRASAQTPPNIVIYPAANAPVVDGVASDDEWDAVPSPSYQYAGQNYYFQYTSSALFILIDVPGITDNNQISETYYLFQPMPGVWNLYPGYWGLSDPPGSYFYGNILFDINGDGALTPDVDKDYGDCLSDDNIDPNPYPGETIQPRSYLRACFENGTFLR
jgi:hypothetical protein